MHEVSDQEYQSDCGKTLRREDGLTPNGNPINGKWVLRNEDGVFVDFDQYRHDLASHHGLNLNSDRLEQEEAIHEAVESMHCLEHIPGA